MEASFLLLGVTVKMFSRLFGRKQTKDSVSDALEQLRNTENILLKKQAFLEAKAATVSYSNFIWHISYYFSSLNWPETTV